MTQSLIHFNNIDDLEIPPSGIYIENHVKKIAYFKDFIPTISNEQTIIYNNKEYRSIEPRKGWEYVY